MGRQDSASGRAGFDQPHWQRGSSFDGDLVAARGHQQAGTTKARLGQTLAHIDKVTGYQWLHVGIGAGGTLAVIFTDLRTDLTRQRDIQIREVLLNNLAYALLVRRVSIGMQQPYGEALDGLDLDALDQLGDGRFIQVLQHPATVIHPFAHSKAQRARYQRWIAVGIEVVLVEAVFVADLQGIAMALGGDERSAGATALDQSIGGKRGAVGDEGHIGRYCRGLREHLRDALHESLGWISRGGQYFGGIPCCPDLQNCVGKSAADVDGNTHTGVHGIG